MKRNAKRIILAWWLFVVFVVPPSYTALHYAFVAHKAGAHQPKAFRQIEATTQHCSLDAFVYAPAIAIDANWPQQLAQLPRAECLCRPFALHHKLIASVHRVRPPPAKA